MNRNLLQFRELNQEQTLLVGSVEWRYRIFGDGPEILLLLPGGELVNDLGFAFATEMQKSCRILYPSYPEVRSIRELADGLNAIVNHKNLKQVTVLGASFGGAVAQVFIRRYPERVKNLLLSNTGVPMGKLVPSVLLSKWIMQVLPWSATSYLLTRVLLRTLTPDLSQKDFWVPYLAELFSSRLTKRQMLLNISQQVEYHRHYRFSPDDLKAWHGRVLIAESETDIIGPKRRKALKDTYPFARIHTYRNAGHAPMFACFKEYVAMVKTFVQGTLTNTDLVNEHHLPRN